MTERVIAAIDPGAVTGLAIWRGAKLLAYAQDPAESIVEGWGSYLRENCDLLAIEGVFIGRGVKAGLSVARSSGWIDGALWAVGVRSPRIYPMPTSWRSNLGFKATRDGRRSKRDDYEQDARTLAGQLAETRFAKSRTHEAEAICLGASEVIRCSASDTCLAGLLSRPGA